MGVEKKKVCENEKGREKKERERERIWKSTFISILPNARYGKGEIVKRVTRSDVTHDDESRGSLHVIHIFL